MSREDEGFVALRDYENITIEREGEVTWLILNRPEKRNAMSPRLNAEVVDALTELETDAQTKVLVLTGAGDSFTAGMDLEEYFRALDGKHEARARASWDMRQFHYFKLRYFPKVTIAAVNGWCFGGGFSPLISCDLAIAAEEATFGLSEVNWGILPGGYVSKDVADVMSYRDALWYTLTGKPFSAKEAKDMRLVNMVVPRAELHDAVMAVASDICKLDPVVLTAAKNAYRMVRSMDSDQAYDYLMAKNDQLRFRLPGTRERGIKQFIDEKSYRPGLGAADWDKPLE